MIREHTKRRRTADGNANGVSVLVRNGDVHVGREVATAEFGDKVLVHVQGVGVDVQFVTDVRDLITLSITTVLRVPPKKRKRKKRNLLADSHDVVWKFRNELVRLRGLD